MNRSEAQKIFAKNSKIITELTKDVNRLELLRADMIKFLRSVSYTDFTVCKMITAEVNYIKSKIEFLVQSQKQVKKFLSLKGNII